MAKQIELTRGLKTIVDDRDYEYLSRFNWNAQKCGKNFYAARATSRKEGRKILLIHRQILGVTDSNKKVDHINGDTLDNRSSNLRICSDAENLRNSAVHLDNLSGFKGVRKTGNKNKGWRSSIFVNGKSIHLGVFNSPDLAARSYDFAARKYFGEFARLNFTYAK